MLDLTDCGACHFGAVSLRPETVCQVGWMVADGQAGGFQLDIRAVTAIGQP